ncbi:MAG TPA: CCA tRNA nucleotidyltransferase [Silvibacterium sp.]|nr:CCA tRNA nucleotidyltransferase [Silvibacterium sp.]
MAVAGGARKSVIECESMADYAYLLENRLSLNQRNALNKVRSIAREHGMTVFLAGGAVRDLTTGFPVRDLDFSVQGNALKLKKSLEKAGLELWGEHEPSRTLFLWHKGVRIEVSSARHEDFPKPGKPVYEWAPILEDLRRRDFTANAMALSLNEGSYGLLLDPLNGIADLESRTLRLVSPYGFIEDPSRLLRAVRLQARLGWEMDDRTKARYQNAKDDGAIEAISPYLKGYELEEIAHEEDALKVLKALEAEGWMKQLFPAWTSAKADTRGLEALHEVLVQLLMQGIQPDLSAAHLELLTAKLQPKEITALKRLFPQPGFVKHWEKLEDAAKDFQKELLDKKNAAPSATWKLLASHAPEPVLWLAYTSKNAQVQTKFKNFATVWPEARQKIPTALMLEMRITPDLPGYEELVQAIFFELMDSRLATEEAMRAYLEPHSPPAPPPPVSLRRTRAKKTAKAAKEVHRGGDEPDLDEVDEEDEDESSIKLAPAKKAVAVKATKKEIAAEAPAKPLKTGAAAKAAASGKPEQPAKPEKQVPAAKAAKAAGAKAAAKAEPVKAAAKGKPSAKKAVQGRKAAPVKEAQKKNQKPAPKTLKKVQRPAAKVQKKPAAKPVKKPVVKPKKKPVAKKPAKPAKKRR